MQAANGEASATTIDLDAYLHRIKLSTPPHADLATLRAIIAAHVAAIPFENLDPFLGITPALDIASVQRKLVQGGRGGYCFEQNRLLGAALRAIGFTVSDLGARVLSGLPADAMPARTHMILRVELDGESWLVDAGYGGSTPTAPLRLVADVVQPTPHEPFRLQRQQGDWELSVCIAGEWKPMYRCDMQPQYAIDYEVSNYWVATRAESKFVANLFAARAPSGRRLALHNRQFTEYRPDGARTQRTLAGAGEIRTVLQREFLIRLPDHPDLYRRLDALPA